MQRPVRWALVLLAALLALFAASVLWRPPAPVVVAARAVRTAVVVPVLCDGTLEPSAGGEIRALDTASVAEVLVKEGERVKKGDVLVRLESPSLAEKARESRAESLRLSADLTDAVAEVERARRARDEKRKTREADRRLLADKAITRAEADVSDAAFRDAEGALRAAEARLASLKGDGDAPAASRVSLAKASARNLEERVAALTVRAPRGGVVYGLPRKAGETVAPGQIVAAVADPGRRRVRARVDQPDLPRVAVGQRLEVTFDGLPERRWEGRVGSVPPGLRDVGGREVAEILGDLDDPRGELPPNASVNVEVVVGEKKGALVVPRAALQREGDARYVWVLSSGRAARRTVAIGLLGLTSVEVTSGLAEGDVVLLPGATPLVEGARVKTRGA